MGESRGGYRVLVWKPEGKGPLETPGIDRKIILRWIFRMGCEGMDWIDVFQDRARWCTLVDTVMNLQVP